jgi:hypothetical protein
MQRDSRVSLRSPSARPRAVAHAQEVLARATNSTFLGFWVMDVKLMLLWSCICVMSGTASVVIHGSIPTFTAERPRAV